MKKAALRKIYFGLISLLMAQPSISTASQCRPSALFQKISKRAHSKEVDQEAQAVEVLRNRASKKAYVRPQVVFSKMADLIAKAENNIQYQVWRFAPGAETSDLVLGGVKRLEARLKRENVKKPVDFWFMINILRYQSKRKEIQELKDYIKSFKIDSRYVRIHLGVYQAQLLGVNHSKSLTIDGKYAFVTGANSSIYNNGLGLYDLGFTLSGEIINEISKDFVAFWKKYTDSKKIPEVAQYDKVKSNLCLPILFTKSKPYNPLDTKVQKSSLSFAMLESIAQAKKKIDILNPNINVNAVEDQILRAVNKGVKVRMVLSKGFEFKGENFPTRGGANIFSVKKLYRKLKNNKRACKLLDIRWYSEDGLTPGEDAKELNSHAKYMSVDNQVTYMGSSNLDNQSFVNSKEIALFVDSRKLTKSWKAQSFDPVFKRAVKVDQCNPLVRKRKKPQRVLDENRGR